MSGEDRDEVQQVLDVEPESAGEPTRQGSFLFRGGPIYPTPGRRLDRGVLLTRDGLIAYVGSAEGLDPAAARRATIIDLDGRPLLPGFCDSHVHLSLAALAVQELDLRGVEKVQDLQERLRDRARETPAGDWVVGHGWEMRRLNVGRQPALGILDAATAEHPVFLASKDLHSAWLNSVGFERVETLETLPGKSTLHLVDGAPSGLVFEDVSLLRNALLPPPDDATKERCLGPFFRHLWSCGITAVHNNETPEDLAVVKRALTRVGARVRVLFNLVFESPDDLRRGVGAFRESLPGWLCTGGAKLFLDGSFGSLTAAVSQPYAGSDDRGILDLEPAELRAWLEAIADAGVPAVMHAIGDRAVELALDELGRRHWPPRTQHRLEHAQLLSERIIERQDLRGLVFSTQPSHMWADREIVQRHLQDANGRRWAYAHRTMMQRGGSLVFGSDAPVEEVDPWKGIQAAVTRLQSADTPPWIEAERISMADALAAYTSRPALLHEHGFLTGQLRPGRLADLVVLSRDPFDLPADLCGGPWDRIRVDMTFLDGALVYERELPSR